MGLPERFKIVRESLGLSQKDMAVAIGVSLPGVQGYEAGRSVPGGNVFEALVKLGFNANWLLTGEGAMKRGESPGVAAGPATRFADTADLEHEYVLVPRYNVKVSLGGGAMVESEQIVDHLAFKSDWIRNKMHLSPADLVLISAIGDSMYPTLRDGDLLLLDKSKTTVADDAIYVLKFDGHLIAKRLQKLFDGSIQIKSDNKIYDAQTVPADKVGELVIIGRVMWIGGRV